MMYILILVLAALVDKTSSMYCQKCHTSNYRECDDSSEVERCGEEDTKCYSHLYTTTESIKNKVAEVQGAEKGCLPADQDCEAYCKLYKKYGYIYCKESCCQGDMCNKQTFQNLFKKEKRSLGESNAYSLMRSSNLLLLVFANLCFVLFKWS